MSRYNEVQIGSTYLTSTGAGGGKPCKVQVKGLETLKTTKTGQIINSADGTPYAQLISVSHKGLPIEILTEWMTKTVFDAIVTLIENAKNGASTIALNISGDTGNFSLTVIPAVPDDIFFDSFRNNYIKGAGFRFMTT
jgi:hypothetical protein